MTIRPHPLALTSAQLGVVMTAASHLDPRWRPRFLQAIADRLVPLDDVTDDAVRAACMASLTRFTGRAA